MASLGALVGSGREVLKRANQIEKQRQQELHRAARESERQEVLRKRGGLWSLHYEFNGDDADALRALRVRDAHAQAHAEAPGEHESESDDEESGPLHVFDDGSPTRDLGGGRIQMAGGKTTQLAGGDTYLQENGIFETYAWMKEHWVRGAHSHWPTDTQSLPCAHHHHARSRRTTTRRTSPNND